MNQKKATTNIKILLNYYYNIVIVMENTFVRFKILILGH